jgi:hypothetical protein
MTFQKNESMPQTFITQPPRGRQWSRKPVIRRPGERGFSLALITVCLVSMVGMLGLTYDLGRVYITKNELQTFVDASALAAATHLDGSQTGVQAANTTATAGPLGTIKPNGYNFDSAAVSVVTATYASIFNGTYDSYGTASSSGTNTYRFINVSASANVPLTFLPALPGISTSMTLTAAATAGEQPQSSVTNGGLEPFAPDAHNAADKKNFGFTPGSEYTLKWGNGNTTTCAGDSGLTPPVNSPSAHGFVDLGQGTGTDNLRSAIVYGGYPNSLSTPSSVYVGSDLYSDPGNRGASIFSALAERSNQDTDQTSTTWAQYQAGIGNGRRVVTVPVSDPASWSGSGANANVMIIGFANFLLDPGLTIGGSSGPICATYIGPGDLTGTGSGGTDGTQVYTNVLYK